MALQEQVELAMSRNILIPGLKKRGQVFIPMNDAKTQMARKFAKQYFSGYILEGGENVAEAEGLIREGNEVVVAGNHIKEWDPMGRRLALEGAGFGKFANVLTYPANLGWFEDPRLSKFIGADCFVAVIPPQEKIELGLALIEAQSRGLTEAASILETCFSNYESLNFDAHSFILKEMPQRLRTANPLVLALYPETEFMRDGLARRAKPEIAALFRNKYVLPMMMTGQETLPDDLTPPKENERPEVILRVGKPYLSAPLFQVSRRGVGDLVMTSILRLEPSFESDRPRYIHPDQVKFYQDQNKQYQHLFE
jgi:hypothetical protein